MAARLQFRGLREASMLFSRLLRSLYVLLVVTAVAACDGASSSSGTAANPSDRANGAPTPAATSGTSATRAAVDRAPATPAMREITIPAGTQLPIVLDTSVGSETSRAEEPGQAHLARAIE